MTDGPERNPFPLSIATDWTVTTLAAFLTQLINDHDRVYQQRWEAQERAMATALIAAEKSVVLRVEANQRAVEASLLSSTKALEASMLASEKAIAKAEINNEKRFESLTERIDDLRTSRDSTSGKSQGHDQTWQLIFSVASLVVSGIAVGAAFLRHG